MIVAGTSIVNAADPAGVISSMKSTVVEVFNKVSGVAGER